MTGVQTCALPICCLLSHCVVTLGERGVFAASAQGEQVYVPGVEVKVVDTVGSGDAFTAGFVHALLRGEPLADCCRLGNALGALVAGQSGATQPISPEELRAFLSGDHPHICEATLKAFAPA